MSVTFVFGILPKKKNVCYFIFLDILIEVRVKMIVYIKDLEPGVEWDWPQQGMAQGGQGVCSRMFVLCIQLNLFFFQGSIQLNL